MTLLEAASGEAGRTVTQRAGLARSSRLRRVAKGIAGGGVAPAARGA